MYLLMSDGTVWTNPYRSLEIRRNGLVMPMRTDHYTLFRAFILQEAWLTKSIPTPTGMSMFYPTRAIFRSPFNEFKRSQLRAVPVADKQLLLQYAMAIGLHDDHDDTIGGAPLDLALDQALQRYRTMRASSQSVICLTPKIFFFSKNFLTKIGDPQKFFSKQIFYRLFR